ncbi:putative ATP-dependent RNA helicase spindle-E [Thelohanellus kitauei]|uniref:Putative ATP-dependent RNA helicase spindle-E n=1 Tax=Thelohanellus kitauei TaxID=669202 RepID=A0A0C2MMP0_THEKT|nr:putative ATP-dependent RNA helicase spindle-E [Thelohanellus kitauei]
MDTERPGIVEESTRVCYEIIKNLSDFDVLFEQASCGNTNKSVLIFLPGLHEIMELNNILKSIAEEQKYVKPVILATNIAESSITVPDIGYVIDFCLQKYVNWDRNTNLCHLETMWISKSSAEQRKGKIQATQAAPVELLMEFVLGWYRRSCLKDSTNTTFLI